MRCPMMMEQSSYKTCQFIMNRPSKRIKRKHKKISTDRLKLSQASTSARHAHLRNDMKVSTHVISTFLKSISKRSTVWLMSVVISALWETRQCQFQLLIWAKEHLEMWVGMRSDQKLNKALSSKERVGTDSHVKLMRQAFRSLPAQQKACGSQ